MKPSALGMVAFLIIIILVAAGFRCSSKPEMEVATYTVEAGDTLWSIAKDHCPNEMDKREWIYEVRKINGINGYLIPGSKIEILKEVK